MTQIKDFGTMPDGRIVKCISISGGGLTANILNYGAILQDLRLEGHKPSLVIGLESLSDYLNHSRYFGAMAGRCANRIANGEFELDGKSFQLDKNFIGKHHLHGGADGIAKQVWQIGIVTPNAIEMTLKLANGHMGYPGNMEIKLIYSLLAGGVFNINLSATSDAPTLCNLAHHSYFNLDGSTSIADHTLQISAEHFLPIDSECIPTGELASLEGHDFDFRKPKLLAPVLAEQMIDHNFCLSNSQTDIRQIGCLHSPSSGVSMTIRSTEPGLQIFDGSKLSAPVKSLEGHDIDAYAGIAIEPQIWPDAIHHPLWPQPILRPGETYHQQTQFVFAKN